MKIGNKVVYSFVNIGYKVLVIDIFLCLEIFFVII